MEMSVPLVGETAEPAPGTSKPPTRVSPAPVVEAKMCRLHTQGQRLSRQSWRRLGAGARPGFRCHLPPGPEAQGSSQEGSPQPVGHGLPLPGVASPASQPAQGEAWRTQGGVYITML